ncbi:MAG: hypothetical protein N5P05_004415 (plasmid) [Chroococcopsis gigantea SAG 12.99]|jgi:hypothetical protein|nr:hypothetical protein [Chroococcopsis gigantea SAG 12.99]
MLSYCLERIKEIPGVRAWVEFPYPATGNDEGKFILSVASGTAQYVYWLYRSINTANLQVAISHLRSLGSRRGLKPLLITEYMSAPVMQELIERGIECMDAVGNMYFNNPPIYILIRGNRPSSHKRETSALTTAGVKVIYTLLCEPQILESGYREIASAAGVALGTANNVIHDLYRSGYLLRIRDGNYLIKDYGQLLSFWELGYAEKLRAKLSEGNFSPTGNRTFNELVPELIAGAERGNYLLGGELAAALCTDYLRPDSATLHVGEDYRRTVIDLRLQPDRLGKIKLLRVFGNINPWRDGPFNERLVHPLLIRAELLTEADDRLRETTELLLDKFIGSTAKDAVG